MLPAQRTTSQKAWDAAQVCTASMPGYVVPECLQNARMLNAMDANMGSILAQQPHNVMRLLMLFTCTALSVQ